VTGWDCDAAELERVGHRIVDLRKAFNIREGWTPEEDTLPSRFFAEPLTTGASAGAQISRERLQEMIDSYYSARGWTSTGYLPEATLRSIAEDTYAEEGA
jgi:aldehyde:ferredoxin oxidoreductase